LPGPSIFLNFSSNLPFQGPQPSGKINAVSRIPGSSPKPAIAPCMTEVLLYDCPSCTASCSVFPELVGLNVVCPNCTQEFTATAPDTASDFQIPDSIPFFKSGKLEILKEHLNKLTSDGELSKSDEIALTRAALMLGLKERDFVELTKSEFLNHFNPILERASQTAHINDEDFEEINKLKIRYGADLTFDESFGVFRWIYLMEVKGQTPLPLINHEIHLEENEFLYLAMNSTWAQPRTKTTSYSGVSVSVPTGIRGVRLKFGKMQPNRVEEISELDSGRLYITNKSIYFQGENRNTEISLSSILDTTVHTDSIRIDKKRGRADYFGMNLMNSRYIQALIGALKQFN